MNRTIETSDIRGYLEALEELYANSPLLKRDPDLRFQSIPALLLHYGRPYEPTAVVPRPLHRGRARECFSNAAGAAVLGFLDRGGTPWPYRYVEGYAATSFPTLHAWVSDDGRRALDLTWKKGWGRSYFGIAFDTDWLRHVMLSSGVYGVFGGEDPDIIMPLLAEGIPDEALAEFPA